MKVLFRADASIEIGSGHVMRCITLANSLRENGHECSFAMLELEGNLFEYVEQNGFTTQRLADNGPIITKADWLIVDHYQLSADWEMASKPESGRIMVIDDLANRQHSCDLLLDQNLGRKESDYNSLLPNICERIIGTKYALLRPEFARMREQSLSRSRNSINHILISLGGADANNVTETLLKSLSLALPASAQQITIIAGAQNPHLGTLKQQASVMPITTELINSASNMAEIMSAADLAIGAAGSTAWERCCLGLPSLVAILADNQLSIGESLQECGAGRIIEEPSSAAELKQLLSDINISAMSAKAAAQVDGEGTSRVVQKLLS